MSLGFSTTVFCWSLLCASYTVITFSFSQRFLLVSFQPPLLFKSLFSSIYTLVPCEVKRTQNLKERQRHRNRENRAGRMLCVLRIQKCEERKNKECFRNGKLQEGRARHSEKYLHSLCNQGLCNPLGLIQDVMCLLSCSEIQQSVHPKKWMIYSPSCGFELESSPKHKYM